MINILGRYLEYMQMSSFPLKFCSLMLALVVDLPRTAMTVVFQQLSRLPLCYSVLINWYSSVRKISPFPSFSFFLSLFILSFFCIHSLIYLSVDPCVCAFLLNFILRVIIQYVSVCFCLFLFLLKSVQLWPFGSSSMLAPMSMFPSHIHGPS